jgi:TatD DNase family protein
MLVDSHCHLDYAPLVDDLDGVVARAETANVGVMLSISTSIASFPAVRAISERRPEIWCTVGIHPHEASAEPDIPVERLVEEATHPRVIGIGETGLDFYYERSPRAEQVESFRAHIAAARTTGLPLVVHTRSADAETMELLEAEYAAGAFPGLIHCFSATPQLAERALKIGFYISFSGILTFRNAESIRAVARSIPNDRVLVETDAPYLAPVPKRGRSNEPSYVAYTAAAVAAERGIPVDRLAEQTTRNFFRLFSKAREPSAILST